jgi:hypothetical protein
VLSRANRTSALWQQFGRLCDVVVREGAEAAYYEELPVDYVSESRLDRHGEYFTVTLEYGADHDKIDPFDVSVRRAARTAPDAARNSPYLHPVVRHYRHSSLAAEHHVAQSLEHDWTSQEAHRDPLRRFFTRELASAGVSRMSS